MRKVSGIFTILFSIYCICLFMFTNYVRYGNSDTGTYQLNYITVQYANDIK